jgi:hypothetical protein
MRDSGMSRWRVSSLVLKSVSSWRVFGRSIGIRPRADVNADASDQPLDVRCRDLRLGEPHDVPAGQERFEVFLGIGDEPGGAIVPAAAFDENAALDLDQRPAFDVGEIGPPFPFCMEHELALQLRPAEAAPVEGESGFEARTAGFGAETCDLHAVRKLSIGSTAPPARGMNCNP